MRDRLDRLQQEVRDAENVVRGRNGQAGQRGGEGQPGRQGADAQAAQQRLDSAREAYGRELQRARESLSRMGSSQPRNGLAGTTPEHHEYSRSAPGNEAFKQDFSGWDKLRQDVNDRLERHDAAIAARLAGRDKEGRFSAGGSDRVPDAYRQSVARYFESLARVKQ
jgi:hypothetical protein